MRVRSFRYGRSYYGRTLPRLLVRYVDCGQAQLSIPVRLAHHGLAQLSMLARSFMNWLGWAVGVVPQGPPRERQVAPTYFFKRPGPVLCLVYQGFGHS